LRVGRLEVVPIERNPCPAQSRRDAPDDPPALLLEFLAQQTIGTVATQE
jgi:hypothetical protein